MDETLPILDTLCKFEKSLTFTAPPVSMMISSQDAHISGLFPLKKVEQQFIEDQGSAKVCIQSNLNMFNRP